MRYLAEIFLRWDSADKQPGRLSSSYGSSGDKRLTRRSGPRTFTNHWNQKPVRCVCDGFCNWLGRRESNISTPKSTIVSFVSPQDITTIKIYVSIKPSWPSRPAATVSYIVAPKGWHCDAQHAYQTAIESVASLPLLMHMIHIMAGMSTPGS